MPLSDEDVAALRADLKRVHRAELERAKRELEREKDLQKTGVGAASMRGGVGVASESEVEKGITKTGIGAASIRGGVGLASI